jgi:hypothetical protein
MTRARILIALALAVAIAILVWLLAMQNDGPPAPPPAATPDASASPALPDTRADLPGATIVPKRASDADGEAAGPESVGATDASPPPKISVLVVDEAGAPQSAIPLAMIENGGHPVTSRATTAADGTAAFSLAPLERLKGAGLAPDGKLQVQVSVALPLDEPVEASFDREKVPESAIRLVLPQTGRVIVRLVTADGAPFTRDAVVEIQSSEDDSAPPVIEPTVARASAIAGVATFARVGKTSRLGVSATPAEPALRKVEGFLDGPRTAAEASLTLVCGGLATRITGRVVRSDARPVPRASVTISLPASAEALKGESSWSYQGGGMSGEDGRFSTRFEVDPATITGKEARLAVDDGVTGPKRLSLTLPEGIRTGLADLGDVVVPELDLVAAGQVVTPDGAPLAGAKVMVMVREVGRWKRDWSSHEVRATTSKEGRFELRGKVARQPWPLGLAADLDGWMCVEAAPFEFGARDVKITMLQGGSIEGSITGLDNADPRVWVEAPIAVSVVKAGTKAPRTGYFDNTVLDVDRRELEVFDGKFEARSLMPGNYSVEFYAKSQDGDQASPAAALLVVDDIVVRPGEVNRDPRLQKIALGKLLQSRVVTVVDQDGRPLRNAQIGARPAGKSGSFANSTTGPDGKSVVATAAATVDLVVALKGYRAETVTEVTADKTVTLRKTSPKRVTVRLPEDVEIPAPPFYLGVSLNWIGTSKPSDGFEWSDPRNRNAETVFFGADRTATLDVDSPGTYLATVWLNERRANGGGGLSINDDKRAGVEIGEEGGTSITVNVDAEGLKRTIASMKK